MNIIHFCINFLTLRSQLDVIAPSIQIYRFLIKQFLYFRDFGLTHVSSGDLLRAHMRDGTALGKEAKAFIDKGQMSKALVYLY